MVLMRAEGSTILKKAEIRLWRPVGRNRGKSEEVGEISEVGSLGSLLGSKSLTECWRVLRHEDAKVNG